MEMIHCKKPEMARNALWAHLLGYNLARKIAAQAAQSKGLAPRQISFAGVVQILQTFPDALLTIADSERHALCLSLFMAIAAHRVGDRPEGEKGVGSRIQTLLALTRTAAAFHARAG
jgi:hypothetical protein